MNYYLGIDGGGTCTSFIVATENGEIKAHYQTSTCHYQQVGFLGLITTLKNGIKEALKQANITKNNLTSVFVALPGYGESLEAKEQMNSIIKGLFYPVIYGCGNDVLAAFAGSLGLEWGVNILAGTGSLAYGQYQKQEARSGGWGYLCGDEGSAYWIGRKLLEIFTKQCDGRMTKSLIYTLVKERLNLKYDFEIVEQITSWNGRRDKIAELATIVTLAAQNKDNNALNIYQLAAKELALQVKSVINCLEFKGLKTIPVSWSGGVFKSKNIIFSPLIKELKAVDSRCVLQEPLLNPTCGAILLAKQLVQPVTQSFINKLTNKEVK